MHFASISLMKKMHPHFYFAGAILCLEHDFFEISCVKIETTKPGSGGFGYYTAELEEPTIQEDIWGVKWFPEIDKWCEETFGPQDLWGEEPVNGWKRMRNKYFFVDDSQLTWFLIKWL
jgi:hypothetical protein